VRNVLFWFSGGDASNFVRMGIWWWGGRGWVAGKCCEGVEVWHGEKGSGGLGGYGLFGSVCSGFFGVGGWREDTGVGGGVFLVSFIVGFVGWKLFKPDLGVPPYKHEKGGGCPKKTQDRIGT